MKRKYPGTYGENSKEYGGWGDFRYLELNKRIRRGITNPRRERLAARVALNKIGMRYKELIPFFNPLHTGFKENEDGTIQWLDFCAFRGHMFVILFDIKYPNHGVKPHEQRGFEVKKAYLKARNIPFLVFKRTYSSQEMEILIRRHLQKEK